MVKIKFHNESYKNLFLKNLISTRSIESIGNSLYIPDDHPRKEGIIYTARKFNQEWIKSIFHLYPDNSSIKEVDTFKIIFSDYKGKESFISYCLVKPKLNSLLLKETVEEDSKSLIICINLPITEYLNIQKEFSERYGIFCYIVKGGKYLIKGKKKKMMEELDSKLVVDNLMREVTKGASEFITKKLIDQYLEENEISNKITTRKINWGKENE